MSSVSLTSSKNTSTNGMICWPILSSGTVDKPGASVGMSHSDMLSLACAGCSSLDTTSMYGVLPPFVTQVFWPFMM